MSNFSEKLKNLFQFIKSKTFLIQIGIALVSLLIFVFVLQWWLGVTTNHTQKIQVPNLHKMSLSAVEKKLNELNLDFIVIDSASFNPNYPKKSVIEQNPAVGDFVKEKRKIYITLNPSKYRDIEVARFKRTYPKTSNNTFKIFRFYCRRRCYLGKRYR